MMSEREERVERPLGQVAILLGAGTIAAFLPALAGGFVNLDDDRNFVTNTALRGSFGEQVAWAWRATLLGVYQPLSWMLLELEHALWGLVPFGYHAVSLILHAANAVVLVMLILAVLRRARPVLVEETPGRVVMLAGLAAALFAMHPLRAEVVSWVSCQPYLPCVLCAMLAVLAYLSAHDPGRDAPERRKRLLWAWGLFLAALLFKAVAVTLPAVLLILDAYPLRRLRDRREIARALIEKIPFAALSAVFSIIACRSKLKGETFETGEPVAASWCLKVSEAVRSVWFYLDQILWPANLTAVYPRPITGPEQGLLDPRTLMAVAGLVGVTALAWVVRKRWPGVLAAWLAYLIILAPNSGLVRNSTQMGADRYSYAASLPWAVLLGIGLILAAHRRPVVARLATVTVPVLLLILTALCWCQTATWRHSEALWRHALAHGAARSLEAHGDLALELARQGKNAEALTHLRVAVRLAPRSAKVHSHLGKVLRAEGALAEARQEFETALRLKPSHAEALCNLGALDYQEGHPGRAEGMLRRALAADPDLAPAHMNLGALLAQKGELPEALTHLTEAARLEPDNAEIHYNLGLVLGNGGHALAAFEQFTEAVRLKPDHTAAARALTLARADLAQAAGPHESDQ